MKFGQAETLPCFLLLIVLDKVNKYERYYGKSKQGFVETVGRIVSH